MVVSISDEVFSSVEWKVNTGQQNLTFFVPRTSICDLSSTLYAEFRHAYRIFLSDGFKDTEEFKCEK